MAVSALLTLIGLQALIAMSPGPAAVITIKTAAANGVKAGFFVSLGLALAIVLWAMAALAGLAIIFEIAPFLQTGLRIAGAIFLIWIGFSMIRHASQPISDAQAAAPAPAWHLIRLGLITNLANPKALVYFSAVFVTVMPADPGINVAMLVLTVIFVVELLWYALLSLMFSRPTPARLYRRAKTHLDRLFGGLIALLGARLAYN
ncbi:LysE family transporter [Yoonia sp. GPGPB17]|uniref:LysE family transporter n=1 Tax=Yoonia sp. GPGPB17 TaxID=3026147 RepID=UPI0030C08A31